MTKERYRLRLVEGLIPAFHGETDMAIDNSTTFDSAKKAFADTASGFTEQASFKARDYAVQGKDRAVDALDNVANLVTDAADQVSERLGDQYGGYIRQAADAVSGLATTLRDKDTDELIGDARDVVRSSPAIAIAAAAAVGFLLARVVKSGFTPKKDVDPEAPKAAPAKKKPATTAAKAPRKAPAKAAVTETPAA